jgi:hypothetical protein
MIMAENMDILNLTNAVISFLLPITEKTSASEI